MPVSVPADGAEVVCCLIGRPTDTEALVRHHAGVVRIEYSRVTASRERRVHLVEEYPPGDPALTVVLSRLRLL